MVNKEYFPVFSAILNFCDPMKTNLIKFIFGKTNSVNTLFKKLFYYGNFEEKNPLNLQK